MSRFSQAEVAEVEREKLAACMTCPICNHLFTDATTISECLHTFCRKCIYKKISDEEWESCPTCGIELGCAPLEKLRTDHNLQDLRTKVFPSKGQRYKAPKVVSSFPEAVPLNLLPGKRKERSLSSLVVGTPNISAKFVPSGKRFKSVATKTPIPQESIIPLEGPINKVDDGNERIRSLDTLNKIAEAKKQHTSTADSSMPSRHKEDSAESSEGKSDLWQPMKHLVETASNRKSVDSDLQETNIHIHLPLAQENDALGLKASANEHANKLNANDDENSFSPSPLISEKIRRSPQKRHAVPKDLNIPVQAAAGASSKYDGRTTPIWFSLVASNDQEGNMPLPQISSCYLRVQDGRLPVLSVKKYLAKKLGLANEAEVEISLGGQPVISTLQLQNLIDCWLKTTPASETIQTTAGSSAKNFMMVLSYGRRAQPQ